MEKPLVSVNICTHNRKDLISKSIKSVFEQDYQNIEIIISDNGDDETEKLISSIISENPNWSSKIHYFKNDTKGISENRNFALEKSSGKYIAVLDSDDYWILPEKISRQIEFLEENTDYVMIGTNADIVNSKDEKIGEIKNHTLHEKIIYNFLLKNQFVHSSVVFKKKALKEYNESLFIWEDYEAFLKISRENKVANLPQQMTAYKKHSGNISRSKKMKGVLTLRKIIKKNKEHYPNYFKARFKNIIRLTKAVLSI